MNFQVEWPKWHFLNYFFIWNWWLFQSKIMKIPLCNWAGFFLTTHSTTRRINCFSQSSHSKRICFIASILASWNPIRLEMISKASEKVKLEPSYLSYTWKMAPLGLHSVVRFKPPWLTSGHFGAPGRSANVSLHRWVRGNKTWFFLLVSLPSSWGWVGCHSKKKWKR